MSKRNNNLSSAGASSQSDSMNRNKNVSYNDEQFKQVLYDSTTVHFSLEVFLVEFVVNATFPFSAWYYPEIHSHDFWNPSPDWFSVTFVIIYFQCYILNSIII